jgi:hypothetical protein
VKKILQTKAQNQKRAKKAKETDVSLEPHVPMVSSDDVSESFLPAFLLSTRFPDLLFSAGFSEEIHRFGH